MKCVLAGAIEIIKTHTKLKEKNNTNLKTSTQMKENNKGMQGLKDYTKYFRIYTKYLRMYRKYFMKPGKALQKLFIIQRCKYTQTPFFYFHTKQQEEGDKTRG